MQHKPSNVVSCVKPLVMSEPASVCERVHASAVSMYVLELAAGWGILALIKRLFPVHQLLSEVVNYAAISAV